MQQEIVLRRNAGADGKVFAGAVDQREQAEQQRRVFADSG